MAKVNIKSEKITPFGGIYYASKAFYALSLDKVINGTLGVRSSTYNGYQWDEIMSAISDVSSVAVTAWKMSTEASVTCGNHLKSGYRRATQSPRRRLNRRHQCVHRKP